MLSSFVSDFQAFVSYVFPSSFSPPDTMTEDLPNGSFMTTQDTTISSSSLSLTPSPPESVAHGLSPSEDGVSGVSSGERSNLLDFSSAVGSWDSIVNELSVRPPSEEAPDFLDSLYLTSAHDNESDVLYPIHDQSHQVTLDSIIQDWTVLEPTEVASQYNSPSIFIPDAYSTTPFADPSVNKFSVIDDTNDQLNTSLMDLLNSIDID